MSLEILTSFNFIDRDYYFHKIDPRTKMFMVLTYLILLFLFDHMIMQIIISLTMIPLVILSRMSKNILKSLRGSTFLFFFIIFFNTIFMSLNFGIQMSLRLMNILVVFSLLFQTTNPDDLSQSFTKMGIPFHLAFSLSLAFRFVPTLANELETISNAQKSRGYSTDTGGIIQQIKNLFPLLIPLITNSIQRAFYIAESLEARSFGIIKNRSNLFPIKLKLKDLFLFIWLLLLLGLGIFLKINSGLIPSWVSYKIPLL